MAVWLTAHLKRARMCSQDVADSSYHGLTKIKTALKDPSGGAEGIFYHARLRFETLKKESRSSWLETDRLHSCMNRQESNSSKWFFYTQAKRPLKDNICRFKNLLKLYSAMNMDKVWCQTPFPQRDHLHKPIKFHCERLKLLFLAMAQMPGFHQVFSAGSELTVPTSQHRSWTYSSSATKSRYRILGVYGVNLLLKLNTVETSWHCGLML